MQKEGDISLPKGVIPHCPWFPTPCPQQVLFPAGTPVLWGHSWTQSDGLEQRGSPAELSRAQAEPQWQNQQRSPCPVDKQHPWPSPSTLRIAQTSPFHIIPPHLVIIYHPKTPSDQQCSSSNQTRTFQQFPFANSVHPMQPCFDFPALRILQFAAVLHKINH